MILRPNQKRLCFTTKTIVGFLLLVSYANAFLTPTSNLPISLSLSTLSSSSVKTRLFESINSQGQQQQGQGQNGNDNNNNDIWLPQLRRVMAGVATAGALETGYLTYNKLFQTTPIALCGAEGGAGAGAGSSCSDILSGPFSYVPFTEIPLSALGFLAYCTVAGLALFPLLLKSNSSNNDDDDTVVVYDDTSNRVGLIAVTTTMGTFSIFLMTLLFGVLQTTCPYCIFSAACSIILAKLAWIGGCLPEGNKNGIRWATSGFLASTVTAVLLFVSGTAVTEINSINDQFGSTGTLLASTAIGGGSNSQQKQELMEPPPITTESSKEALELASTLQAMNAKMYGAYWCSHCYDQKQIFGKEAYSKIEYVECSKDGVNSKTKLCKAMDVPGYPTWEIQGKLYPGQQELDELQDLVKSIKEGTK